MMKRIRAIVLKRTNYGEADRVLQLLTPDGKISVIAKGVRREKSRLSGGIELFAICEVVIAEGRGDLGVLTSARMIKFYRHIVENYDRLQFGYDVIKWVAKVSEMAGGAEWYDVLSEVIAGLDAASLPLDLIKACFYLRYSNLTGYSLGLWRDTNGEKILSDTNYRYDSTERGLTPRDDGQITSEHIKLLRLIATKKIKVLAQIGGIQEFLPVCLDVARAHAAI